MGNERDRHSTVIVAVRFNRFGCVVVKLSFVDDAESVRFHSRAVEGMRSKAIVKANQTKQPDCRPCAVTMVVLCPGGPLATVTTNRNNYCNCSTQSTSWGQWQTVKLPMVPMPTVLERIVKQRLVVPLIGTLTVLTTWLVDLLHLLSSEQNPHIPLVPYDTAWRDADAVWRESHCHSPSHST